MLNPLQFKRLHALIDSDPALGEFDGFHLASVRTNRTVPDGGLVSGDEGRPLGQLYPPARIFGEPLDPACLVGIKGGELTAPTRTAYRFGNARILGFNAVLSEDDTLFAPMDTRRAQPKDLLTVNSYGHQGFLLRDRDGELVAHFVSRPRPRRIDMDAVFFHNLEPGNYGSFMFRQLPQMTFAAEATFPVDCYVTAERTPWFLEAISVLGLPERPVFTVPEVAGEVFRSVRMFAEPESEAFLSAETRAGVARLADRGWRADTDATGSAKLYVSRALSTIKRPSYRPMLNEAEVEDAMRRRGFRVVYPETLSLCGQIRSFYPATHVIGPSGSGMFNVMFAASKPRVVDIETFTVAVRQHAKLYASCGCEYGFMFAPTDEADQRPPVHRRWRVPPGLLDEAVDWLLG